MNAVRALWIVAGVGTLLWGCNGSGVTSSGGSVAGAAAESPFGARIGLGGASPPASQAGRHSAAAAPAGKDAPAGHPVPRFQDVHRQAGLHHVYLNGERGRCLLFETTGGGAGWLDYDGDGLWDLYLNQGGDATAGPEAPQPSDRLFRNRGDGTFEDVTEQAGIREFGYSQGVAIGDYDNDGYDDIYVTNLGRNTLWHNRGDGTFAEVTEVAGVGDNRWSTSAAWADLDGDGLLDLYVANYCVDDPHRPMECKSRKGTPSVCHPGNVPAWPDEVYFNRGDGSFSAEFSRRGFADPDGRGLGVAVADFNNDGLADVFVSNDTTANYLFINQGGGRFEDQALLLGCATDAAGSTMANMGIAVYDFDHNGWLDVYVTHFRDEADALYRNYGPGGFQDESALAGIRSLTMEHLSFGVVMADFNQDGLPELICASGHIENAPDYPYYRMTPLFFVYDGQRWHECGAQVSDYFGRKYVGRAVATADYDEDGDLDLVVVHENDPAALLRNDSARGHWLKFRFLGRQSNRRGIGARVVVRAGQRQYMQELCGGTSYAATHQPALVFGLGAWKGPCEVTVRWPSGRVQQFETPKVDQAWVLDEAEAAEPSASAGKQPSPGAAGRTVP